MNIKKIIKIFIFSLFFVFLSSVNTYSNSCEYTWKINECIEANKNMTYKSIEDFVCINWSSENPEQIIYQIVLDGEFKEIDEEMDDFLFNLEENKNTYFWKDAKKTYIDWVNDIFTKKGELEKKYKQKCGIWEDWKIIIKAQNIITKVQMCNPWTSNIKPFTSIDQAIKFFPDSWTDCSKLVAVKMEIFENVAFNTLALAKQQVLADQKKLYDQWQRKNYDKLLNIMMINLWYLERIWQKWSSKIKHPHN